MIALDADTAMQVTESVDQAIEEVFGMMAKRPIEKIGSSSHSTQGQSSEGEESSQGDQTPKSSEFLTVTLSLDGGLQGTIGICLSSECALEWTENMLCEKCDSINQDVIDACGELGNMVVGGAKRRLGDLGLTMGLPNAIRAGREAIEFPTGVHPINLKYQFADSTFDVFVVLAAQ